MIPKVYKLRLRKKVDFFDQAQRFFSRYFLVFYRFTDESLSQMVVIVPKKNIKLRVKRTQVKRVLYGLSLPLVRESSQLQLVLVVNKKVLATNKKELLNDLVQIFSKLAKK